MESRLLWPLSRRERLGDIKTTTYFLHTAYRRPLNCDFYITRLYDTRRRRYVSVVVMTATTWSFWNGLVITASLEKAANLLPKPVQVAFQGQDFVIATYDLWKEKVKHKQEEEG